MIGMIVTLLSVLLPLVHLGLSRHPRTRERVIHLLLLYALVLDVGVVGLILGFIPHVFFPDKAAQLIGWPPGSPFQFEVGLHDGAWGLLGFLSLWIGGSFWIATGLGWSVFMLGGHIRPHLSNVARRKLCSVQFPDDLFRRFYCGLAFGVAVLVLPLGRISEARLRQQAREQPGSRAATCP